jgi:hypothetical protein
MKRILSYTTIGLLITMSSCYTFSPCLDGYGDLVEETRDVSGFYAVSNNSSFDVYVSQGDEYSVKVIAQDNIMPVIETNHSGGSLIIQTREFSCIRNTSHIEVHVTMPEIEELSNNGSGRLECISVVSTDFELRNTGSGRAYVDTIFCDDFYVVNTGSGQIYVEEADALFSEVKLSGSGRIDFGDMYAEELVLRHTSSGNIDGFLIGAENADITLSGSGRITLAGDVYDLNTAHTASGRMDMLDLATMNVRAHSSGSGDTYVNVSGLLEVTLTGSGSLLYIGEPTELNLRTTGSGSVRMY